MKPVGKPDADGHVRFDERGWETRGALRHARAHPRLYRRGRHECLRYKVQNMKRRANCMIRAGNEPVIVPKLLLDRFALGERKLVLFSRLKHSACTWRRDFSQRSGKSFCNRTSVWNVAARSRYCVPHCHRAG